MSDSTAKAQSHSAPAHHPTGDCPAGSGTTTQLINHLNDCSAELSRFSTDVRNELIDILATISPQRANHILDQQTVTPQVRREPTVSPVVMSQPAEPLTKAVRSQDSIPAPTKIDVSLPTDDDQSRLAAIKARIADRLRQEMTATDTATHQGGHQ